MDPSAVNIY